MKGTVAVLCLLLAVINGVVGVGFTGDIAAGAKNVNTWVYPKVDYRGCASSNTTTPYLAFSVYIDNSNSTLYHVYALLGDFGSFMHVYIYNSTFDATQPCQGVMTYLMDSYDGNNFLGDEMLRQAIFFAPGTYTFVVSTSYTQYTSRFAIAVEAVDKVFEVDSSSPKWMTPQYSSGSCTQYSGNNQKPMALHNITVATSGYYDVLALVSPSENSSAWYQMYLAIYNSTFNITDLETTGCNNLYQWGTYPAYGYISYLYFEAGITYTAIASGTSETSYAKIGFQVVPTRTRFFSNAVKFPGLDYFSGIQGNCKASGGNNIWVSGTYVAAHSDVAIAVTPPTYSDPERPMSSFSFTPTSVLYQGDNSGSFNQTAPAACPTGNSKFLKFAMSGGTMFATGYAGSTYTIVLYPNSMEDLSRGNGFALNVYAISGTNMNGIADQTTTGGSNNHQTTTSQSSANPSQTSTTSASAETGDAATTGMSIVVLLAVVLIALI